MTNFTYSMPLRRSHPALSKQWHPTKNGSLSTDEITAGSGRVVWWKCDKGPDHEWSASVGNRANLKRGCPCCAGKKVSVTNCLANCRPDLAKEWHPTKNGSLTPREITVGSEKKVWWRCAKDPSHVWSAMLANRTKRGRGCRFCASRAVSATSSLAYRHPAIAKQWHPTKNGTLLPENVLPHSNRRFWWRCERMHEWPAKPSARLRGSGCPECGNRKVGKDNSIAAVKPDIVGEWDMEANGGVHPGRIVAASKKKYKWRCREGHVFEASARSRTVDGTQCHYCTGQKTDPKRSIAVTRPDLVKQWDVTKNLPLTPTEVLPGSGKRVHWRCDMGPDHQWRSTVASRATDDDGCPYCARRRLSVTNSLQAIAPQLAAEWHPTRNGDLTPKDVLGGGHRKVFWQCPKGPDHEWVATLASRLAGNGCPCCRGLKVSMTNSLATCYPEVAAEWHPNNPMRPEDVVAGSHKRALWRCRHDASHVWSAAIVYRTIQGNDCARCNLNSRSKREIEIAFEVQHLVPFELEDRTIFIGRRRFEADLRIDSLRLVVEYDGAWYHRSSANLVRDREKTAALCRAGWRVIRIRERPLQLLHEHDVGVAKYGDLKECVVAVLRQVEHVTGTKVRGLGAYSRSPRLANAAEARAYIDELLARQKARKAGRRRSRHRRPQRTTADTGSKSRSTRRR